MEHITDWIDWQAVRRTFSWQVVTRSFGVTFVIGTILNAINQGTEIVEGKSISFLRLGLTYAVPFFVASFGAYSAFRHLDTFDE
ncbi:MAG: nitrate/nitrite transporter NrtS [Alphaproteobacteria bacterium]|nr:nitrate/nitrite transporter NrtS [Alphaproteobacteria bacterium]MDE2630309.1 nitrate/nitrite transporter NrtS [Alphaproteobacteria bacterium]